METVIITITAFVGLCVFLRHADDTDESMTIEDIDKKHNDYEH